MRRRVAPGARVHADRRPGDNGVTVDGSIVAFIGIAPGDNVLAKSLLLAGIHAVLGLLWLPLYAYAIDRLGTIMRGARRWLERLSGAARDALGLRVALERR
jgi:threonine/homoserine/homoserine lactone efflux protein